VYQNRFLENWQEISSIRKPIIAAVSGYAVSNLQKDSNASTPTSTHYPPVVLPSVHLIG